MRWNKINEEVAVSLETLTEVKNGDINDIMKRACDSIRKRSRLCMHNRINERIHEMFIALHRDSFIRPHKHLNKTESIHVVEGTADLVFFNTRGEVKRVVKMGDYLSDHCFFFRMAKPQYHMLLIRSDVLVVHETTGGPFDPADTVFPDWAPMESDINNRDEFLASIEHIIMMRNRQ